MRISELLRPLQPQHIEDAAKTACFDAHYTSGEWTAYLPQADLVQMDREMWEILKAHRDKDGVLYTPERKVVEIRNIMDSYASPTCERIAEMDWPLYVTGSL